MKTIFRVINSLLLAATIAAGLYCGNCAWMLYRTTQQGTLDANIQATQDRIAELEASVAQTRQAITEAETGSQELLKAATERNDLAREAFDTAAEEKDALQAKKDALENADELQEQLRQNIAELRTKYGQTLRALEDKIIAGESEYKICYLTFDDGPSYMTDSFLEKLEELDVRATFFTIGVQMPESSYDLRDSLLRQEALAGHNIANHTYTHAIHGSLYKSLANFMDAVEQQEQLVYEVTGIRTDLVRFPAGSYYSPHREKAIAELEDLGYGWIDWIGNACDSGDHRNSSTTVANTVINQSRQDSITVILMHDWREETLGALERIVTTLRAENYLFLPLYRESSTVGTAKPKWG